MSLAILKRDNLPDGTKIQLENWDGHYGIGTYPIAKNDYGYTRHKGKIFRLGLTRNMPDNDKVEIIYKALVNGESILSQYENQFWFGDEDRYTLGLIDEIPNGTGYGASYKPTDEGTPYEFRIEIDGQDVFFGFDGKRTMTLWGGSFSVQYPKQMTYEEVKDDIRKNYQEYKQDDLEAHYRAWGYWD